jgi:hypothetical protein
MQSENTAAASAIGHEAACHNIEKPVEVMFVLHVRGNRQLLHYRSSRDEIPHTTGAVMCSALLSWHNCPRKVSRESKFRRGTIALKTTAFTNV